MTLLASSDLFLIMSIRAASSQVSEDDLERFDFAFLNRSTSLQSVEFLIFVRKVAPNLAPALGKVGRRLGGVARSEPRIPDA
jgi:hypothetical protein